MSIFVVLPHQLFNKRYLDKKNTIILWEHPHYFKSYNYNKKKLLLHHGSMKYYYDYLKKAEFRVKYVGFDDDVSRHIGSKEYLIFDPIDKIKLPENGTVVESPNFLMTLNMYKEYRDKTDKFFFAAFYKFGKNELNIIPNTPSQDKNNRKKMSSETKTPPLPTNSPDDEYIAMGKRFVNKNFPNNPGTTTNFQFPLTHATSMKWLTHFIKHRFNLFGDYQDAIVKDENYLFHSMLSTSINIGLINPSDIIAKIIPIMKKIPLNSFEGYIRQLFWREYQRYCYIYFNFNRKNYFGNRKRLTPSWYDGSTGIEPVDDCIVKAFENGYLHHIERLMVVGNYMNLSGISPTQGYQWFMEFSCDSYDWVMHQNVYEMVFFCSGGETTRKPYISSSNYILKMGNYKKGDWSTTWDKKYQDYLKKNKEKLYKFRYHFRLK